MTLSPPTKMTFRLSILIAIMALLVQYIPQVGAYFPNSAGFLLALIAFVLLALGNVLKGF